MLGSAPPPVPSGGHPHRGGSEGGRRVAERGRWPPSLPFHFRPGLVPAERRSVLPPPARPPAPGAGPARLPARQPARLLLFPPQRGALRHSRTQVGWPGRQEAGAPAARRPPRLPWSPRPDSSPCSRWVRTSLRAPSPALLWRGPRRAPSKSGWCPGTLEVPRRWWGRSGRFGVRLRVGAPTPFHPQEVGDCCAARLGSPGKSGA